MKAALRIGRDGVWYCCYLPWHHRSRVLVGNQIHWRDPQRGLLHTEIVEVQFFDDDSLEHDPETGDYWPSCAVTVEVAS